MPDIVFNGIRDRINKLLEVMNQKESPIQFSIMQQSLQLLDNIEENLNKFEDIWSDDLINRANNKTPSKSSVNLNNDQD